jgi:hypothetical protein
MHRETMITLLLIEDDPLDRQGSRMWLGYVSTSACNWSTGLCRNRKGRRRSWHTHRRTSSCDTLVPSQRHLARSRGYHCSSGCPTVRAFAIVDQDQSDNVTTTSPLWSVRPGRSHKIAHPTQLLSLDKSRNKADGAFAAEPNRA